MQQAPVCRALDAEEMQLRRCRRWEIEPPVAGELRVLMPKTPAPSSAAQKGPCGPPLPYVSLRDPELFAVANVEVQFSSE